MRAFAEALEVVPSTLAENAGLNPIEICTQLRGRHARGETAAGINVRKVRAPLGAAPGCVSGFLGPAKQQLLLPCAWQAPLPA